VNRALRRRQIRERRGAASERALHSAHDLQRRGRLAEARAAYERRLAAAPGDALTHHALGLLLKDLGELDGALARLRAAARLDPANVAASLDLGRTLYDTGALDEAVSQFETVLRCDRSCAAAWRHLGLIAARRGLWAHAEGLLCEALTREPHDAEALIELAGCAVETQRPAIALALLERAAALRPTDVATLTRLGDGFASIKAFDPAVEAFHAALTIEPDSVELLLRVSAAEGGRGRYGEALRALERARRLAPRDSGVATNLAIIWRGLGDLDRATAFCQEAMALNPGRSVAKMNLATILLDQGRPEESLALVRELRPDDPDVQRHQAYVTLLIGDFAAGLPLLEKRLEIRSVHPLPLSDRPRWRGEALAGRSILVEAEEGIGDTIQFLRYVPLLAARGARVIVALYEPLIALAHSLPGGAEIVTKGRHAPPTDLHIPIMSLPLAFGTTPRTIPWNGPYLSADPAAVQTWRERLGPSEGLRIGLVWAGNPRHPNDCNRSMPLSRLASLCAGGGRHRFFSLQVGAHAADLAALPEGAIADLSPHLSDYAETAAAITALDLVISVDTSVAHVAGALGKPTWVLLPCGPDWRWLLDRPDTPWYPSLRLFRCPASRAWHRPLDEIRALLARIEAVADLGRFMNGSA
jgi:tetratricopeptide (TPR) repeat protein